MIEKLMTSRWYNFWIFLVLFCLNLHNIILIIPDILYKEKINSNESWILVCSSFACGTIFGAGVWRDLLIKTEKLLDRSLTCAEHLLEMLNEKNSSR